MKRGAGADIFLKTLEKVRAAVPGIALRTCFIVGFPGESSADFEILEEFIGEARFDWLGVFSYSDEEGSARIPLDAQAPQAHHRVAQAPLMKLQQTISKHAKQQWVGRELVILAEGESEETPLLWEGRTAVPRPGDRRQGLHQRLRRSRETRSRPLLSRRDHRSPRLRPRSSHSRDRSLTQLCTSKSTCAQAGIRSERYDIQRQLLDSQSSHGHQRKNPQSFCIAPPAACWSPPKTRTSLSAAIAAARSTSASGRWASTRSVRPCSILKSSKISAKSAVSAGTQDDE